MSLLSRLNPSLIQFLKKIMAHLPVSQDEKNAFESTSGVLNQLIVHGAMGNMP
jgi:hypothetical protein